MRRLTGFVSAVSIVLAVAVFLFFPRGSGANMLSPFQFRPAQALTGCVMGSVPPFSLNPALAIVVEEDLLGNDTLFFNAGRLDRSMELDTKDWLAVARPRISRIAA